MRPRLVDDELVECASGQRSNRFGQRVGQFEGMQGPVHVVAELRPVCGRRNDDGHAIFAQVLGNLIGSAFGTYTIEADPLIINGVLTLLLKWLLSMAICSILLLLTTGVRNKTLAAIVGVIFGTGTLGLVYMGLSSAVTNIFKTEGFNLAMYMPDGLMGVVNVSANTGVLNTVIVSAVCIALFFALTIRIFNTRDIK